MTTPENKAPATSRLALLAKYGERVARDQASKWEKGDDGFKRSSTPAPPLSK